MDSGCLPDSGINVFFGKGACSCCAVVRMGVSGVRCGTECGAVPAMPLCCGAGRSFFPVAVRGDSCCAGTGRFTCGEDFAADAGGRLSCRAGEVWSPLITTVAGVIGAAFLLVALSRYISAVRKNKRKAVS